MRYGKSNGWLDDQPAAVTRKAGNGRITYIGAALDPNSMKKAVEWMLADARVSAVLPNLPEEVDVAVRSGEGKRVLILTNYNAANVKIDLPRPMKDVIHGGDIRSLTLDRYGVVVLQDSLSGAKTQQ